MSRKLVAVVFALSAACAAQQKVVAKNESEMSVPCGGVTADQEVQRRADQEVQRS